MHRYLLSIFLGIHLVLFLIYGVIYIFTRNYQSREKIIHLTFSIFNLALFLVLLFKRHIQSEF